MCTMPARTNSSIRSSRSDASTTRSCWNGSRPAQSAGRTDARGPVRVAAWRANPSVDGGQAVIGLIGTIDETLRPHLGEEENEVLPIASAWISPEEWAQLPGHAVRQSFAGDKPWLAIGLIRERLTPEHGSSMLSGMPPPLQTLWTDQWEPAYNAFIAEVRQ